MATLSNSQSYNMQKENEPVVADGGEATRSPSEVHVELTSQTGNIYKAKRRDTVIDINIKFVTHVGLEGVLVLLFMLIITGLFVYATYEYTSYFNNFQREFVWLFMLMALIFFLAVLWFTATWKKIAVDYTKRATGRKKKGLAKNAVMAFYADTFINGPLFLWKLYIVEFCESINQIINLFTVYLCSLPVGVTIGICIALGLDSWSRGYGVLQQNTPVRRDRQIKIDIVVDFLCVALPILIMWFGYNVPISVVDMMQIALFPAFCLWTKLRSIFREIIRVKCVQAVLKEEDRIAKSFKRRRKSLYSVDETISMAKKQQSIIPHKVRVGFVVYNVLYGLFLCCIAIVHLAAQNPTTCEQLLWKDSCKVKTPFCLSAFRPTCNCVVLNVRKHNWTTLPDKIHEMNALKVMRINHGPLEVVPDGFEEKFSKVSRLDLSYNALTEVPESLGNMAINKLQLANNNLNELPDSVWGNDYIFHLELDNNNISYISSTIKHAKLLNYVFMSNNSLIKLPRSLFEVNLITLYLDGNMLTSIPEEIGILVNLRFLKLHNNNNISTVPASIGHLKRLNDIDLRNNAIANLPLKAFTNLNSLKFVYLHMNPICSNGWLDDKKEMKEIVDKAPGAGCKPQCSMYCQDRYLKLTYCYRDCNSEKCKYQNGVCKR